MDRDLSEYQEMIWDFLHKQRRLGDNLYFSPTYIAKTIIGFRYNSAWACSKLKRLVKLRMVTKNRKGHYRAKLIK